MPLPGIKPFARKTHTFPLLAKACAGGTAAPNDPTFYVRRRSPERNRAVRNTAHPQTSPDHFRRWSNARMSADMPVKMVNYGENEVVGVGVVVVFEFLTPPRRTVRFFRRVSEMRFPVGKRLFSTKSSAEQPNHGPSFHRERPH